MATYWWIENKNGELIQHGRENVLGFVVLNGNIPNMQLYKSGAKELCRKGERPVKVKIVKVK